MVNFPTSLDSFTNPTPTDQTNSVTVPHATQHANLNDAVEALEAKVGADNSAVTTSLDYQIRQKQGVCEEKTGNFTASNHGNYIVTATATVTDPTPEAGHGFTVLVRNGTVTVGGTAYSVVGTRIERVFHSGAWASYVWYPVTGGAGSATQVLTSNGASAAPSFQAAPSGSTDLSYTAATRVLASSTGTDATLPLVTSSDAGLAPASGGGTTNFLRADGTWAAPSGGGGSAYEFTIQGYEGPAVVGILGQFDATTSKTLAEVTIISPTLPVGSNLICELRKNSTTSGNILSSTLQVTTTESLTNGRYVGTPVTSFTSASIADGDVLYAVLTGVGSTTPASNVRVVLRFSA